MQTTKGRASPKESPTKVSPRPTRQLKISPVEHSSSNATARTPKDKSPKLTDRRTPRSPICEKRPSKLSELESQICKLQNDLKIVKDQLIVSESLKKEAEGDAADVKRQLADVSLKLEECQKQLSEIDVTKNTSVVDQQEDAQDEQSDATNAELESLKKKVAETCFVVESMKYELEKSKECEAEARNVVNETLLQLEAAKETVNALRSDVINSKEAYNSVVSELQLSRAQVSFLESFVNNLKNVNPTNDHKSSEDEALSVDELKMELEVTKSEVRQLRIALEASELRYNEQRSHSTRQIESATELLEKIKAESTLREAELAEEHSKASAKIDELKSSLMDKETALQAIAEENESLNKKLEKSASCPIDQAMEAELAKLKEHVAELKAQMMDKETEAQSVLEESETLKLEISKRDAEVEAARAAEVEATTKVGYMMEEVDKSNRKVARVTEQLETAQALSADMEAELRRLKVQSDQWRKAAEAAASMLSPDKCVDRTASMPLVGRISSPYLDDYDDDSFKKKNGNVLKKIGVLWKRPHK
ncbi:hypothetical protein RND81_11G174900 [Saponaria officinalis]